MPSQVETDAEKISRHMAYPATTADANGSKPQRLVLWCLLDRIDTCHQYPSDAWRCCEVATGSWIQFPLGNHFVECWLGIPSLLLRDLWGAVTNTPKYAKTSLKQINWKKMEHARIQPKNQKYTENIFKRYPNTPVLCIVQATPIAKPRQTGQKKGWQDRAHLRHKKWSSFNH